MGFLNPAIALAGLVLGFAILVSYLLRPSRPTRRVSSTFLWLAAFHELHADRPWRRIPPTVLLLVQLLALAAIIAALARPYVASTDAPGLDAIVLLDVSASMQATDVAPSRFEAARAHVVTLIDGLQPGQTMSLLSLGAEPRVIAPRTGDRQLLHQAVAALEPTSQAANLPAALSLAASLADGHPEAQVTIVGDGSLDQSQVPAGLPVGVRFVGIGSAADNLAVAAFGTRMVEGHLAALARVANYGADRRTVTLQLNVDGARFDARLIAVEPGGSTEAQWDDLPLSAGVIEARLVERDGLALDNAAWAVGTAERPTRVLLVSTANLFIERALALRRGVEITRSSLTDYTPETARAQPFDLIVFDSFLPAELPSTGGLLVVHPPTANGLVPAFQDIGISRVQASRADHPLLEDVSLTGVHVNRARRLQVPAWADPVLEAPETPLLLIGEQAGHRVAVLGFDVHQSDLPLQPAFPVLVQHLLDWLVPNSSVVSPTVRVGDPAAIVPLATSASVEVVSPAGVGVRVAPPFPPPPFGETSQPGVYQVVQRDANGQETRSRFAVNFVDPAESSLRQAVSTAVPGSASVAAPTLTAPRELWEFAAVLALALLAFEWWIFQRR